MAPNQRLNPVFHLAAFWTLSQHSEGHQSTHHAVAFFHPEAVDLGA
jgi:hypothetical protein